MSGKRGRTNKVTLGMLKGKSITTSVPSIAVRFHSGDEELDIYPSADDEDDGEKDEVRSLSGSATVTSSSPPSNASPSILSRDPSPMKEYLKGLGKRSTSVDAGIMDVGSSGSDTWRIFHELKGKITKTVEEKLTEIKSERRSVTPLFSGKSSPRHGRLRAGGNSQDNSSISDSEDISETSNKDEAKSSQTNEATPTTTEQKPAQVLHPMSVQFLDCDDEETSRPVDEVRVPESTKKKSKKDRKSGLRHRKGGEQIEMSSLLDEDTDTDSKDMFEEDIESGVEVSEETKFVPDSSLYGDVPTVDFRVSPPVKYTPTYLDIRRKSSVCVLQEQQAAPPLFKKIWAYRNVILSVLIFLLVFFVPIPSYIKGMIVGVLISMFYHLIVGITNWYLPKGDMSEPTPFKIPNYTDSPILEVPIEEEIETITKYGGWMNELTETYDPDTYHINNTNSVYVRLNGSILRISHPKSKIPKRHLWNERKLKMKFIHQRIYDISDCSIKLLPEGITRKRRWSKKYPLCIMLTKESKMRETVVAVPLNNELQEPTPNVSNISLVEENSDLQHSVVDEVVSLKPLFDVRSSESSLASKLSYPSVASGVDNEDSLSNSLYKDEAMLDYTELHDASLETVEASDDETFCIIDEPLAQETCLYLFSRTDRQKEDWYRKFVEAIKRSTLSSADEALDVTTGGHGSGGQGTGPPGGLPEVTLKREREYAFDDSCYSSAEFVDTSALRNADINYIAFMNKFHLQVKPYKGHAIPKHTTPHMVRDRKSDKIASALKLDREVDCDVMWINAFVGRILYDVLQNPIWIEKIQGKIQKKLGTIKLPFFVEELLLTGIELGRDVPMIHRASRPILDDHGLWVDLDVTFDGCVVLTIETKINLMKLKKEVISLPTDTTEEQSTLPDGEGTPEKSKSPIYDSSVEDSAESSPTETDEEHGLSSSDEAELPNNSNSSNPPSSQELAAQPTPIPIIVTPAPNTAQDKKKSSVVQGKGVIKMMNKFVASQFFQSATENKYIKRAMEGVSNTQITLTVEVRACTGQLAVNFPPPPSDRLWFGFRGNPRLWIAVKPKFGHRQVNISYVTSWLEKKLLQEFQKKFVLPNMDDLVIHPMRTDLPV